MLYEVVLAQLRLSQQRKCKYLPVISGSPELFQSGFYSVYWVVIEHHLSSGLSRDSAGIYSGRASQIVLLALVTCAAPERF